jgi:hypothetical protein
MPVNGQDDAMENWIILEKQPKKMEEFLKYTIFNFQSSIQLGFLS